MGNETKTSVFILDTYNKYHSNKNVKYVFNLYDKWYCIREINQLEWGKPIFPEQNFEDEYSTYRIFNTFEEALEIVKGMRKAEGTPF